MTESGAAITVPHWHPEVIPFVLAALSLYAYLVGPVRIRLGIGEPVTRRQVCCALLAALALFLAEGTPLHSLSEMYLFSAHMFQHVLLTLIMPPLALLATPDWLVRHLLRHPWAAAAARALTRPLVAFVAFNATYALWHFPLFYQLPLLQHWIHVVQHITLVVTAFMMWMPLLSPSPLLPRLSPGGQIGYCFALVVAQLPVFAPVTFATAPIYEFYAQAPRIWGLSALEDQRWAGIIMKLGGMAIILIVAGIAFFRWAREEGVTASAPARTERRATEVQAAPER